MTSCDLTSSNNAVNDFLLNTKAKTTKKVQHSKLKCFCKFIFNSPDLMSVDWSILNKLHVLKFLEHKIETIQFNTANNYLTVLKIFALDCLQNNVINHDTYTTIKNIKKYKGKAADNGRSLNLKEIRKIKGYFEGSGNGKALRDYAVFALAIGCGLRRAEISSINIEHIKNRRLQVTGKGNKSRMTYLPKFAFLAVKAWKNQLSQKKGALFVHIFKGDKIGKERLGVKGIHYVIEDIQKQCRLSNFTTHDLRRTYATTLLSANVDIFTVQDLLGHSDPITTKRYDKRNESVKIRAIELLPF